MKTHTQTKSNRRSRVYVGLGLLIWVAVLALLAHQRGRQPFDLPMSGVRSGRALLQLVRTLMLAGFVNFASFIPVGALCVFMLVDQKTRVDRIVRVAIPALGLSLALAIGVNGFRSRGFAIPNALTVVLPWVGGGFGCWAAMAYRRGRTARIRFIPQVMLVCALAVSFCGILVYRAIDPSMMQLKTPQVTSAEKRRLYSLFSGKNPLRLEPGQTVELSLTAADINLLLAWGLPLADHARSAMVEIADKRGHVAATMQIPGTSRFINAEADGTFGYALGKLRLEIDTVRIGRVAIPGFLVNAFAPALAQAVMDDTQVKPLVAAVERIEVKNGAVTLRYTHGRPPKGFIARLFHDEGAEPVDVAAIRGQLLNLLAQRDRIAGTNDERFGKTVQAAFRYAQQHSGNGAVAANQSAVLALGIALGHPRVETLIGSFLDDTTRDALRSGFSGTTLRRRDDWPKHFFVSAALTVIAAGNVSDATGLFKEEKDAGGGSGFSFADLLADRSGTTFAQVATRSESSARALQARLEKGFIVDDYFPPADGLPEGLQDAEFQKQMGGVGGPGYTRLIAEIEARVARCAAYKNPEP